MFTMATNVVVTFVIFKLSLVHYNRDFVFNKVGFIHENISELIKERANDR